MPDLPAIWPADRISDDHTVEDRIHNAEVVMKERCAQEAEKFRREQLAGLDTYTVNVLTGRIADKIRSLM